MAEDGESRIQPHRVVSAFFLGASLTLLLTAPVWPGPHAVSAGWTGLWLVSTLGSAPLGIMLLAAPSWRMLPLEKRRSPALVYLAACFLDVLALTVMLVSLFRVGPAICLPAGLALGLAVLAIRLYPAAAARADDLFP